MRKLVLLAVALIQLKSFSQIIYSENFSSLSLGSYTASNGSGSFTYVPGSFQTINDGHYNSVGSTINPNTPFNYLTLKTSGWVIGYNSNVNDTFLVSTSWLDTSSISVDRWIITPAISITAANTVLRWQAMSPDPNYRDGYEVYTTTVTGNVTLADLPLGNRVFALADNNTSGAGENSQWTSRSVNLDAYIGQTLRFAFRNNSKDRFQLWLDDIEVLTLANSRDVALTSVEATKYQLINIQDTVKVEFENHGAVVITTLTLNYMYGNSAVQTQTFATTLGWGNAAKGQAVFSLPYYFTSPGYYKIKAWASLVNGAVDQNITNDTASFYVTAQSSNVVKNCLLEQFVSAANGDTPDAQDKALAMASSSVTIVNVHDNDSMYVPAIANLISDYKSNYSTALVDRVFNKDLNSVVMGKTYYALKTTKRLTAVSPASVTIVNKTFNTSTRELSFTIKADFVGEVRGDYRINAYLTENQVCGKLSDTTINGYNQYNDYYSVPWSPYYQKGYFSSTANSYILNAYYKHQNVLIHAFDGAYGTAGTIPSTGGTAGQSYQQTFTVTIPTATNGASIYNVDNIYLVAYVAEGSTNKNNRTILNSVSDKLTANAEIISVKQNALLMNTPLTLYPNPSAGIVYLNLNKDQLNEDLVIRISDVLGRHVYTAKLQAQETPNELDLSGLHNGAYFVEIDLNGTKTSKKLIIQH